MFKIHKRAKEIQAERLDMKKRAGVIELQYGVLEGQWSWMYNTSWDYCVRLALREQKEKELKK